MNRLRSGIRAFTGKFYALGEIFIRISNNTVVPPLAFRPGMHAIPVLTTNRAHTLFVAKGRNYSLITVER